MKNRESAREKEKSRKDPSFLTEKKGKKKEACSKAPFLALFSVFYCIHDPQQNHGADDGDDQAVDVEAGYFAHVEDIACDESTDKGTDDPGDDVCHSAHGFVFAHNFTCDPSGQCAED